MWTWTRYFTSLDMIPHMCKGQIISLRLYTDFLILSQALKSESYNWQVIFTSSTPSKGPLKAIWKKANRKVKEEKESSGVHLMNKKLFRGYFGRMYGTRRVMGCQKVNLSTRIWVNEAMNCVHNETRYQYHDFLLPWRFRRGQKADSIVGDSHILKWGECHLTFYILT